MPVTLAKAVNTSEEVGTTPLSPTVVHAPSPTKRKSCALVPTIIPTAGTANAAAK